MHTRCVSTSSTSRHLADHLSSLRGYVWGIAGGRSTTGLLSRIQRLKKPAYSAIKVITMSSAKAGMEPGVKYILQCLKEWGPLGLMKKVYYYDEVKLGVLKGTDFLGNKYFEEKSCQHGRHRWVEYNPDLGPWDSSRIPAEWHGWMTHMTDNTESNPSHKRGLKNNWAATVPNGSEHEGSVYKRQEINGSVVRPRGYNIGSIFAEREGMQKFWTQRGNPLSDKFKPHDIKIHAFDPNNPEGKGPKATDRIRDLGEL